MDTSQDLRQRIIKILDLTLRAERSMLQKELNPSRDRRWGHLVLGIHGLGIRMPV